ncbi:MAG: DUF4479 domain-containing protein [Bacillota bacterium]|nr:DUF4479 domain-containing protein [Bacillota bacterium]
MYRLFYDHDVNGDVLFCVFKMEPTPDRVEKKGQLAALYKGDELIGINIFDLQKLCKIKSHGLIVTPDDRLIDALNSLIENAGLPKLPYCRDSGFKVGEVVSLEEHPLDEKAHIVGLDFGPLGKKETVSRYKNLEVGSLLVCALEGTIKFDGSTFHESVIRNIGHQAEICSGKELRVNDDLSGAFIAEGYQKGEDFFLDGK